MIGYGKPFSYRTVINGEEIELRVKHYEFISNELSNDCYSSNTDVLVDFYIEDSEYITSCRVISIKYKGIDSLYRDIINSIFKEYYDILPQNGTITLSL